MKEDIIRMAREAGWPSVALDNLPGTEDMHRLERFADLARADEREACADECVRLAIGGGVAADCAAAIRARGQA
jgi:hypothetical protein